MLEIKKILCPLDFSEFSTKAYDYARSLARHYEATLLLQHVVQPLATTYPYYAFPDMMNEAFGNLDSKIEEKLDEFLAQRGAEETHVERYVHNGMVTDCILDFANQKDVDMIVMGTHGRHGFDRLAMGSVAEKVLRKASCPVLVVRKPSRDFVRPNDASEAVRLKKILLCTDFSAHSSRALAYALSLAMEYDADLTLLHVLEDMPAGENFEAAVADFTGRMESLVSEDDRNWCRVHTAVRIGKPYQQILQVSLEQEMDLVVLGVRGRNVVDLAVFGSTTQRVIQVGSSPVLAVHI